MVQNTNKITFFSRFEADILAGKKTITIRDKAESYFKPQQQLNAFTNEYESFIAHIRVISVTPVRFEQLSEQHAKQENMSLAELQQVIRDIYPNENNFFVIEFELIE